MSHQKLSFRPLLIPLTIVAIIGMVFALKSNSVRTVSAQEYLEQTSSDLQSIAGYFTSPAEYNRFVVSGIRTPDDPFKEVICNNYMGSRQFVANINRRLCMLGLR